jgi:hypothetical protein
MVASQAVVTQGHDAATAQLRNVVDGRVQERGSITLPNGPSRSQPATFAPFV